MHDKKKKKTMHGDEFMTDLWCIYMIDLWGISYDGLLDFGIDVLVCIWDFMEKHICIFLRLDAYVIYVLLLEHAYMLVLSPLKKGNTCIWV